MHPDRNPDDPETAQQAFMELRDMYEQLKDDEARKVYDRFGEKFASDPSHMAWLDSPATMAFTYISYYGERTST